MVGGPEAGTSPSFRSRGPVARQSHCRGHRLCGFHSHWFHLTKRSEVRGQPVPRDTAGPEEEESQQQGRRLLCMVGDARTGGSHAW